VAGGAPVEIRARTRYKKSKNTCESYVAKKSKYCKEKIKDESDVTAIDACPETCGGCG
jgi:hypothetical protein